MPSQDTPTSDLGPLWLGPRGATTEQEVSMMRDEEHPHQCPYCDLRFRYAGEIRDHVLFVEPHELP